MIEYKQLIINWFNENKRDLPWRGTNDPYNIFLSEFIMQQTRIEQGKPYFLRLKTAFPSIEKLASASEEEILFYWQGLGYYSRARH
ncbi:MAG: A/G-specific adenine glycosylase, partial [Bacteroidales bacterium]|nr:A/G-specific adenine glycosylase [Bacteroidales bacterium]